MSEENFKNPLEVYLEKMEELLSLQVEQNNILQGSVIDYQASMSKLSIDCSHYHREFINLSEKLPQEILRMHEKSLNVMNNNSIRFERNIESLDTQLNNAIAKATKNVSGVELSLNEKDRKALSDTETQIKKYRAITFLTVGMIVFCLITVSISIYAASSFYDSSVLSKEEMRQNVLDDIQRSEQEIYSESYFNALENERQIIEIWKNANPKDSKSYLEFRRQVLKDYEKKDIPYFETLSSNETSDGFGKKFRKGVFD